MNATLTRPPPRLSDDNLQALLKAADWNSLRDLTQRLLGNIGLCDFMLKMEINSNGERIHSHLFGSLPAALMNSHTDDEHHTNPIHRHLAKSSRPMFWQVEHLCILDCGQLYHLLKARGLQHGLSMMVRGEQASSHIEFYNHIKSASPAAISCQADALMLATYLHDVVETLWRKTTQAQAPRLTERELECLEWSAAGKTCKEIGQLFNISQHTAYFHLKNASVKLGAIGARHAVSRAVALGLLRQHASSPPEEDTIDRW